ncbi:3614_t:CDS:10 [Diversispora eburnea]|uniref:3614_t:CDS:1 n=1 Tax=Diversispora eburnea TaxID=1213867 RepID=A0A9N8VPE3_9GLOM|nr:3614_t:CDS:10 [Diversispora eburnea]
MPFQESEEEFIPLINAQQGNQVEGDPIIIYYDPQLSSITLEETNAAVARNLEHQLRHPLGDPRVNRDYALNLVVKRQKYCNSLQVLTYERDTESKNRKESSVLVYSITNSTTERQIREVFEECGFIQNCEVKSHGIARITFFGETDGTALHSAREAVIRFNGKQISEGHSVKVELDNDSNKHTTPLANDIDMEIDEIPSPPPSLTMAPPPPMAQLPMAPPPPITPPSMAPPAAAPIKIPSEPPPPHKQEQNSEIPSNESIDNDMEDGEIDPNSEESVSRISTSDSRSRPSWRDNDISSQYESNDRFNSDRRRRNSRDRSNKSNKYSTVERSRSRDRSPPTTITPTERDNISSREYDSSNRKHDRESNRSRVRGYSRDKENTRNKERDSVHGWDLPEKPQFTHIIKFEEEEDHKIGISWSEAFTSLSDIPKDKIDIKESGGSLKNHRKFESKKSSRNKDRYYSTSDGDLYGHLSTANDSSDSDDDFYDTIHSKNKKSNNKPSIGPKISDWDYSSSSESDKNATVISNNSKNKNDKNDNKLSLSSEKIKVENDIVEDNGNNIKDDNMIDDIVIDDIIIDDIIVDDIIVDDEGEDDQKPTQSSKPKNQIKKIQKSNASSASETSKITSSISNKSNKSNKSNCSSASETGKKTSSNRKSSAFTKPRELKNRVVVANQKTKGIRHSKMTSTSPNIMSKKAESKKKQQLRPKHL